jgi:hypothetical protein
MTPYPDTDVMVFEKQDADEHFLILVNVRNENKKVQVPQSWIGHEVEDEATDKEFRLNDTIELEPFEYLILK